MQTERYDRRSLLKSMLMGPAALFSLEAFNAQRCDAAAAIGPNDNIKVTKIETFVLKNSWVFVKISTDASIKEMIPPGCLVMLTPLIVGFFFGVETLSGVLAGSLVSGVQVYNLFSVLL